MKAAVVADIAMTAAAVVADAVVIVAAVEAAVAVAAIAVPVGHAGINLARIFNNNHVARNPGQPSRGFLQIRSCRAMEFSALLSASAVNLFSRARIDTDSD
jgi:hypothetical protein